jgi:hypothetical protein
LAQQVLKAVGTANFDQTYLATEVAIHQAGMQTDQQEAMTATDPNAKQYAQNKLPIDELGLLGAQRLQSMLGSSGSASGSGSTTGSGAASGSGSGSLSGSGSGSIAGSGSGTTAAAATGMIAGAGTGSVGGAATGSAAVRTI